jgi:hypothetical protein
LSRLIAELETKPSVEDRTASVHQLLADIDVRLSRDELMDRLGIAVSAVTREHVLIARDAYRDFAAAAVTLRA